jgi:hypothetical protein
LGIKVPSFTTIVKGFCEKEKGDIRDNWKFLLTTLCNLLFCMSREHFV